MEIRPGEYRDLPAIDKIYNQAIAMKMATADMQAYTKDERREWFEAHKPGKYPVYVAIKDNKVVGYMTLTAYRPRREALKYAVEISYFVEEGNRGVGIGSMLLAFGLDKASELGYRFIVAILMGHNKASIRLLKKFGFTEWGRLPAIAIYDNKYYDHLIYGLKV